MADDPSAADRNVEIWKIKKLIKSLEAARGWGSRCQFLYICMQVLNDKQQHLWCAIWFVLWGDHMLTSLLTAVVESSMVDRERHRALYSSLFPKYCVLYDKEREMLYVVSFEMSSTFGTTPFSRLVEVTCGETAKYPICFLFLWNNYYHSFFIII